MMCMKLLTGMKNVPNINFLRNLTVEETGILNINVSCALQDKSEMRTHTHPQDTSEMRTHTHPRYTSEVRTYARIYI